MMKAINEASAYLKESISGFKPQTGIVLGTGLNALVDHVDICYSINYQDIPNFPVSTVEQHKGKLIFGVLQGVKVVIMQGRFHFYEGHSMKEVAFPIRVLKLLDIEQLFISNAAGGINENFELSDLMAIEDHINLFPDNPLVGENLDELGSRWPDMFEAYNRNLIEQLEEQAMRLGINIKKGIYAGVPGPNLETPAEYKYLKIIGADAVGMSTVPEVIAAVHMGLPVLAVSVITDLCYPSALEPVSIEKIIDAAQKAESKLVALFSGILKEKGELSPSE